MRAKYLLTAIIIVVIAALFVVAFPIFASKPLLSGVTCSPNVITPNGDGIGDETLVNYVLGQRADVKITLKGDGGKEYILREKQTKVADSYQIRFDGTVSIPGTVNTQVLPDGTYVGTIEAVDEAGKTTLQNFNLTIKDADSTPPEITEIVTLPNTISPNGDDHDDDMTVNYTTSKKAEVTLFATGKDNHYYLLDPPTKRDAAMQSFKWDGTQNGGELLPDGAYTLHIQAKDAAKNLTEVTTPVTIDNGGTPRLEIIKVKFSPTAIPLGGTIHVEITVRNTGDTTIEWNETMGPWPGTRYDTNTTFSAERDDQNKPKYFERYGVWRVGLTWTNAPSTYPIRWAIGKTLTPGEETTISGDVQVLQRNEDIYFSAGVEQGGVGFPGGAKGTTKIKVSW